MSQELHYTSVPRGLKPGARGFCTVASTTGLSPTLAERLEGLSGYRAGFPPDHPQASKNPVAWSHLRINATGQTLSVISRVGPAGLDYTERPNKYAHHLVLESSERSPGGPAWVLEQPGFMATEWEGAPRQIATGRRPSQGDRPGGICRAWAERTGDAGWGGALAEAFLADSKRQVVVVFDAGVDVLPLFGEAIALLPADRRWEVTFQTYFTGLPPGIVCLWRGVLRDTPEERQSRGNPDSLMIDLAAAGRANGGSLVHWARTGEAPASLPSAPSSAPSVAAPRMEAPAPQPAPRRADRRVAPAAPEAPSYDPYALAPPPVPSASRSSRSERSKEPRESARSSVWPIIAACLLTFIVGSGFGGITVYLLMKSRVAVSSLPVVALAEAASEPRGIPAEPRASVDEESPKKSAKSAGPGLVAEKPAPPESKASATTENKAVHAELTPAPAKTAPPAGEETSPLVKAPDNDHGPASRQPAGKNSATEPGTAANGASAKQVIPDPSKKNKQNSGVALDPGKSQATPPPKSTVEEKPVELPVLQTFEIAKKNGPEHPFPIKKGAKVRGLHLIGGEDRRDSNYKFKAGTSQDGIGIEVSEQHGNEGTVRIGSFTVREGCVWFRWNDEAEDDKLQNAYQSCVMEIVYEDERSDFLLLGDPQLEGKLSTGDWKYKDNEQYMDVKWLKNIVRSGQFFRPLLHSVEIETPDGQLKKFSVRSEDTVGNRVFECRDPGLTARLTKEMPFQIRFFAGPSTGPLSKDVRRKYVLEQQKNDEYFKLNFQQDPALARQDIEKKLREYDLIVGSRFAAKIVIKVGGKEFLLADLKTEPKK